MFHYIFIDPNIIGEAAQSGSMGLGRLIEFLIAMKRDCLFAETDSYRVESEIGDQVRAIESQQDRKEIKELLTSFAQSGPILLMEGDDGETNLVDFVLENADRDQIDLILTPGESDNPEGLSWEKSNLSELHRTRISQTRANLGNGKNFTDGEVDYTTLYSYCFYKLVRHAEVVCIYDYALGKYWNNSQPVNLEWIVRFLRDSAPCLKTMIIYTDKNEYGAPEKKIADLQEEVDFTIELKTDIAKLPHNRYLGADRRYLDIDLGLDLCDQNGRSRGCQIKYASRPKY